MRTLAILFSLSLLALSALPAVVAAEPDADPDLEALFQMRSQLEQARAIEDAELRANTGVRRAEPQAGPTHQEFKQEVVAHYERSQTLIQEACEPTLNVKNATGQVNAVVSCGTATGVSQGNSRSEGDLVLAGGTP